MSAVVKVAVAGATGYTGIELLRLLARHPGVELVRITSEQYAGSSVASVYPSLSGEVTNDLEPLDPERVASGVEAVFSALPHGTAARTVAAGLAGGARVIDLSADFRLQDASLFARWYGEHPVPELLGEAVYGIPEFSRARIRDARLVAVPGCYPTGALFGLVPLARAGVIDRGPVVIDAKSGASGAGRSAKTELLFCEVEENIRAYSVGKHRHQPEIEQEARRAGFPGPIVFTPHLLPIRRGILSTIYVPIRGEVDLEATFRTAYGGERFVRLLGEGASPEVRHVRGTNLVHLGWTLLEAQATAVVLTAIDNLGKGAASQAIQSFNVMFGFAEDTALDAIAAVP
jgi:N-acetyl-gamma-glutamyl-phosphate reductase